MSDPKADAVERAWLKWTCTHGFGALASKLEAEGWTPPPAPKPTLEISDAVERSFAAAMGMTGAIEHGERVFWRGTPVTSGLRAAIRVWLKEALQGQPTSLAYPHWFESGRALYHSLTGEEWPT